MPLQAVQYSQQGLRSPAVIVVTWAFAVMASVVIVADVGARIFPDVAQHNRSSVLLLLVVWLSIEVAGTLAMSAAAMRIAHQPPSAPIDVKATPRATRKKQVSALSAEDLLAWLRLMLVTPDEQLPSGIEHVGDGQTLITSERKLAGALSVPRSTVTRLLKRLETEGVVQVGRTHRDTYIHLPAPTAKQAEPPPVTEPDMSRIAEPGLAPLESRPNRRA
jgi:hypothetical protein